jgi:hypothetical protein
MRFYFFLVVAVAALFMPLSSNAQQPNATPSPTPGTACYMPKPDYPVSTAATEAPQKKTSGVKKVRAAIPAKNAVGTVSVPVNKPFPKCAADLSSISPENPVLSTTIDGDPSPDDPAHKIGSPECLLLGAANSSFAKCSEPPPSPNQTPNERKAASERRASAEKEKLPSPDFAVINLVHWHLNDGKPLRDSFWYLYDRHAGTTSAWKVSDSLRIKGSDEVGFLAVHFGIDDTCGIQYSVEAKQRTPTNVSDLQELYKAASSIVPGLPSPGTDSGASSIPDKSKKTAAVEASSPALKESLANDAIATAETGELNTYSMMLSSTVSPDVLPKAEASDHEKKLKLWAVVPKNPIAASIIAKSAIDRLELPKDVKTPEQQEDGAGVYGYASFKGLEKLPYDLTLTGKPDGKPRAVTDNDDQRYARTFATIYVNPPEGSRADENHVAVKWDKRNVSVTCAPVPAQLGTPAHADNSFNEFAPQIRAAAFRHRSTAHPVTHVLYSVTDSELVDGAPQDNPAPDDSGKKKTGAKTDTTTSNTTDDQYTSKQTYTNEGPYSWDVSIGVTAYTAQKNTFSASDGTVQKSTSRPENIYVFADYFPWKADLVDPPKVRWKPSISGGIPAGSQPLNRPVAGLSFGFKLAGFHFSPFIGTLFLREYRPKTLTVGSSATDAKLKADLTPRHEYWPFVSINFSVKDAASLIKNKGTSQTKSDSQSKSDKSSKKGGG